jgi:hypothetical protein
VTQPSGLRDGELEELLLRAYLEVQRDQEEKGALPRSGQNVLSRFRVVFECLAAIQLGLLVACVTILLNFLVVVKILHLDVSRYLGFLLPM